MGILRPKLWSPLVVREPERLGAAAPRPRALPCEGDSLCGPSCWRNTTATLPNASRAFLCHLPPGTPLGEWASASGRLTLRCL